MFRDKTNAHSGDLIGLAFLDFFPLIGDLSLGGRKEPHNGLECCAFARAVSAEEDRYRIGLGLKRDPLEDMVLFYKGVDIFGF